MKEEAATDALLRQFLLGKVEDEERERIESLFITDSHMRDRVFAAEQELIDDYLEDCLSTADRETFLSRYGDTVSQRRKLRIARSIQEWAVNQPKMPHCNPGPTSSTWSRLRAQLRLKPVLVIPVAVTATIAIVVSIVWINSRRTERNREYLAIQQELAQLNTPSSLREALPPSYRLTLRPGSVRSVEPQPELKIRQDSSLAELRLLWMQKEEYPTYTAVVRRPGDDQPYTLSNLKAEIEDGRFIPIKVRAHFLIRGNYEIELRGLSADGTKSHPEVYSFTVSE